MTDPTRVTPAYGPHGSRLRRSVGMIVERLDMWMHRPHSPFHSESLCLAFDIVVAGWGPNAADWDDGRNWFVRLFYRWYWQGACTECGGHGYHEWVAIRQIDGSMREFKNIRCERCDGGGLDPQGHLAHLAVQG